MTDGPLSDDEAALVFRRASELDVELHHRREGWDVAGLEAVVPVIGEGDRLGEPLGLVVDAPRPDGVHVAPVRLRLRVHHRVAVDLAGGGEEEAGALRLGQAQAVVGAEAADLERLDRHLEVVDG